jgi:hypothetical protein
MLIFGIMPGLDLNLRVHLIVDFKQGLKLFQYTSI